MARDPRPEDWEDDMRRGLARDRDALGGAQPLHGRLRAARQTAASALCAGARGRLVEQVVGLETRIRPVL